MYNSPLHYCPYCKEYVALDQTPQDCQSEHDCAVEHCPLAHLFLPGTTVTKVAPGDVSQEVSGPHKHHWPRVG